jgi:hypothetical protein
MRKLGIANIRLFVFLSIVIALIIFIFAFGILKVLSYDKTEYIIPASSLVYDKDYNYISLKGKSVIFEQWDNNYYITTNNKDKYKLGKQTVVYNESDYKMYEYGDIYQVYSNGNIVKKTGQTPIIKNTSLYFYKLEDRKYLIVDKKITDQKGKFSASKYLVVVIDKIGNALLINDEISIKTVTPMILKTSEFLFDIANEKLILNDREIDLKKINGSTNQYAPKEEKAKEDNTPNNNNNNTGGNINNGSQPPYIPNNNSDNNELPELQKRIGIRSVNPNITYLDVEYYVVDPVNEYVSVYLLLNDGSSEPKKLEISKDVYNYRINNLKPNTEYNVSIGYSYLDKKANNSKTDVIQDVITVRTAKPDYRLVVSKISNGKIYFNLKLDEKYNLESGFIVLYVDNNKMGEIPIDPQAAISTSGWESSINFYNSGYEVLLKLESAVYNGSAIDTDVQFKYINY